MTKWFDWGGVRSAHSSWTPLPVVRFTKAQVEAIRKAIHNIPEPHITPPESESDSPVMSEGWPA